jgi:hypothetical protein
MVALVARGDTSEVAWVHDSAPLATRVSMLPVQFLTGLYLNWDAASDTAVRFVCAAALCAVALLVVTAARRERSRALPMLLVAATMIVLPLSLAVVKPSSDYFLPRYLIAALVPLTIVVAGGLAKKRPGLLAGVALVAILLSMSLSIATRPALQRPDWRGAATAIGPAPAERAVITNVNVQGRPLLYYAPGLSSVYDGGSAVFGGDSPEKRSTPVVARQVVYLLPTAFASRAGRVPPATGFRLTLRRSVNGFSALAYTAGSAHRFTAGELADSAPRVYGYRLGAVDAPAVYVQRPR